MYSRWQCSGIGSRYKASDTQPPAPGREFSADLHNQGPPKDMRGCNQEQATDRTIILSYLQIGETPSTILGSLEHNPTRLVGFAMYTTEPHVPPKRAKQRSPQPIKNTDNTVQDEPTWSISTTRGFPTSEKIEFDRAKRAHHEYPIFVTI